MGKKKINIILLCIVLGLWGTVIFKYVRQYFVEIPGNIQTERAGFNSTSHKLAKDTFELLPVRDPFLKNTVVVVHKAHSPVHHIAKKALAVVVAKPALPFPEIEYFGYIKSEQKKETVIIKYNGKMIRLKANEAFENFIIRRVYKDSVLVKYNGESRTYQKSK